MKIFKTLILITALAISLVSCKKDKPNDDDNTIKARIIGTWQLYKTESNDYENGVLKFSDNEIETEANSTEFKSDGTITIFNEFDGSKSGTYSITNSGKTLNLIVDGRNSTYEIRAIITTDLVLYSEDITTTDGITRKFTNLSTFKRK